MQPLQKKKRNSDSCERVRPTLKTKTLNRMWLPLGYHNVEFEKITPGSHIDTIRRYIDKLPEAIASGYGMMLHGENGVGKTGAAAVVLIEARKQRKTGLFLSANSYIADCIQGTVFDDSSTVQKRAKEVDLLVLDDLGKEPYGKGDSETRVLSVPRMLEDLIRTRIQSCRSTIITMNFKPLLLEKRYGKSFTELLREKFALVHIDGPSKREIEKNKMQAFFDA